MSEPLPVHFASDSDDQHWYEPNLGPTEVVRQHVVPSSYLAGFAEPDGLVNAFDLETNKAFRQRPDSLGYQKRFNNVGKLHTGEAVSTEPWLASLENAALPILKMLSDAPDASLSLSTDQERDLARYLAAQSFRVPAFRDDNWRMKQDFLAQVLPEIKHALMVQGLTREQADEYIAENAEPDFREERDEVEEARLAAFMLGEVQGFANLIRAMPWRVGFTASPIYTSDNPFSGIMPATDDPRLGTPFAAQRYYFPISKNVLLVLLPAHIPDTDVLDAKIIEAYSRGDREYLDFDEWTTSIARHVISLRATRLLYGPAPHVDSNCSAECLKRIRQAQIQDAVRYQGVDPIRPLATPRSHTHRGLGLIDAGPPNFQAIHLGLWSFLNYLKPLQDLKAWTEELIFIATEPSCPAERRDAIICLVRAMLNTGTREVELRESAERVMKAIQFVALGDFLASKGGREFLKTIRPQEEYTSAT